MNRLKPGQEEHGTNRYATGADFCRAFQQDVKRLYLLGFLLTANHREAERCMMIALEKAPCNKYVFREFVRSWIKRSVINSAIQSVFGKSGMREQAREPWGKERTETPAGAAINDITQLASLDRFVFVMSVLEGCSNKECSLLLKCPVETVASAKLDAFTALRFHQTVERERDHSESNRIRAMTTGS